MYVEFPRYLPLLGKKICLQECRQSANVERRAAISLIALCLAS